MNHAADHRGGSDLKGVVSAGADDHGKFRRRQARCASAAPKIDFKSRWGVSAGGGAMTASAKRGACQARAGRGGSGARGIGAAGFV